MMRILALLILCHLATLSVSAQFVDTRRLISVSGEAKAQIPPDRAAISIGVVTEGLDVAKLKENNDQRVRAILDAVRKLGIDAKDIQTSQLSIEPVYNYNNGRQELLRYKMNNVVSIEVKDLRLIEGVVNASVSGGSNLLNSLDFFSSRADAIRDSLRVQAVRNARKRAQDLVQAAGAQLGKVVTITEDHAGYQPTLRKMAMMAEGNSDDSGTPVSAGELTITLRVNTVFEIEG